MVARRIARASRFVTGGAPRIARPHPHMLRHTFVTTMLDAGVDLRDAQIAAHHADPRTTMRYDRVPGSVAGLAGRGVRPGPGRGEDVLYRTHIWSSRGP